MVSHVTHPKVLVIDDEDLFREMLKVVLSSEYEVLSADSTEAGLRVFNEQKPDTVLLDLVMPGGVDGIRGLKAIREADPNVSVIIVTGYGKLETAKEAISLGANYYVEKPINPDDLRSKIRECVQRTQFEKRRENTMQEMNGLIRQLTTDLEQKAEVASRAEAAVELMYDITCPLADSLASMEHLNKMLHENAEAKDTDLKKLVDTLGLIERNVQRCRELTELCRDLTTGRDRTKDGVQIMDILHSVIDEMTPWAAAAGVQLDCRLRASRKGITGNPRQLHRAIKNLIASAIQSSIKKGGIVRLTCIEDKGNVEIRIEDRGEGYDLTKVQQEVGTRFKQRDVVKGAGLGFCITSRIVEKHGGYMHLRSAPGRGTVVFVKLPISG